MKLLRALTLVVAIAAQSAALRRGSRSAVIDEPVGNGRQNVVTYDSHSLLIHGQRIFILSGEFHPFRLPVPGLWIDVFQKVKALGFSAASFYVHWALLEGQPGVYNASGIFALEPFFDAASAAGIYLIARPGPYINGEVSGGGYPGWLARIKGKIRTRATDYLDATNNYVAHVGATISKYQITNGGPVIMLQPENEYDQGEAAAPTYYPDPVYFSYVLNQFRDAGITVPLVGNNNNLFIPGTTTKGTTEANVDIWGVDNYPLGFDCALPYNWSAGNIPNWFESSHESEGPVTPNALEEFQGGSFDYWGGYGFESCATMFNNEFDGVFYKKNLVNAVSIMNLYMIFGGTNWGNLGYPGGYTSYDYGAAINENREITREKYSEAKLEANFLRVSPALLSGTVDWQSTNSYTNTPAITTTPLFSNIAPTAFYVVRHSDFTLNISASYNLKLSTSKGTFNIPQLGGTLTLGGRDSKWHVTDYDIGGFTILYSTAEIFTWKKFIDKTVVVVYGGPGEQHELAIISSSSAQVLEGPSITTKTSNNIAILNWHTSTTRTVVKLGTIFVYILHRNTAYNYWVPDFPRTDLWGNFTANVGNTSSVIVQAGYLIRSVYMDGTSLHLTGDLNATVPLKLIGAPPSTKELYFNGQQLTYQTNPNTGELSSVLSYSAPNISNLDLSTLPWKYIDNLPEIQPGYNDSAWRAANLTSSNNPQKLNTPTSLYASDYGYNIGVLIYRGHFTATGAESTFSITTQGGTAFGSSVWLGNTYVGSWAGSSGSSSNYQTYNLPKSIQSGKEYVFTVVIDHSGIEENMEAGDDGGTKTPRGITYYSLSTRQQSAITWKLTGNLGGEAYIDKVRGPLNEGGLYAERQGFTQPNPPNENWTFGSPLTGIKTAGIAFYQTSFQLNVTQGYDISMNFNFGSTTKNAANSPIAYQAQLWVNGYQFGKYINHIGPQSKFPVPPGILNYQDTNWVGIEIWAREATGAHLTSLTLEAGNPVLTSLEFDPAPQPSYSVRSSAY